MEIKLRNGEPIDLARVKALYRRVAAIEGGIARGEKEITDEYISEWIGKSSQRGWWVVAEDLQGRLVGSVHAYRPEPQIFHHILNELTIAVDPRFQGNGVGRRLFVYFQDTIKDSSSGIKRVELFVRESNQRAKVFYESIGFQSEGRFEGRIKNLKGGFEADIPMAWIV